MNNTAIAPTYIMKKRKAKNSQFSIININDDNKKHRIKFTIACIEFFKEITIKAVNAINIHKKLKINFINIF